MKPKFPILFLTLVFATGSALAASFIVPTDEEMVSKSDGIAVAIVEGSFTQEVDDMIETVYELRLERSIKGGLNPAGLLRVVTLGGTFGNRGVLVPGAARFAQGERVLVFLTRDERGRWRTTDLTLGKFKFLTSTRGERLLVRDLEDVVGWDHAGRVYREKVRKADGFLRFVEEKAKGRAAAKDYEIDAAEVTLAPSEDRFEIAANATSYPAATYTDFVNNQPIRWPAMTSGVRFYKRSDQNISGASDGGVSVIQGALAAWTNEPGSVVNLIYAGQTARPSANHDATNVVEFNDPQNRISGSWSGSGTVGIAFLSFSGSHSFLGQSWLNITDADVVFQNGYPATNASFASAMTHEIGHGIGWRHSNQNHASGGACNAAVEECTSAAIMNSSVSANYGFNLQPWDVNAAQSVYPGTTSCTAPAITAQPASRTIVTGSSTTLSVTASGTAPLSYQWYVGASGNTASPVAGATASSLTVSPSLSTSYWVRVSNACGVANSTTATVTVSGPACTAPAVTTQPTSRTVTAGQSTTLSVAASGTAPLSYQWYHGASGNTGSPVAGATSASLTVAPSTTTTYWVRVTNACGAANSLTATVTVSVASTGKPPNDFNGDGRSDILWRNNSGENAIWLMNAFTLQSGSYIASETLQRRVIAGTGDFDGDGKADILWRDTQTGENFVWLMNGFVVRSSSAISSLATSWNVAGIGDFDGDGRSDILWRNEGSGANSIWLMNGFTITAGAIRGENLTWQVVGVGDFDGDGRSDILWRNTSGENAIWLMNRFVLASGSYIRPENTSWTVVGVGDFNGDGRSDILWRNTSGENAIWLMNRFTLSSGSYITSLSTAWTLASIGDYNGDGRSDLFWRNQNTGANEFWLMNGFAPTRGAIRSENLTWTPAR